MKRVPALTAIAAALLLSACGRQDAPQARLVMAEAGACELYFTAIASYPAFFAPADRVYEGYLACLRESADAPQIWDIAPLGRFLRSSAVALEQGEDGVIVLLVCDDMPDRERDAMEVSLAGLARVSAGFSRQGHEIRPRDCRTLR